MKNAPLCRAITIFTVTSNSGYIYISFFLIKYRAPELTAALLSRAFERFTFARALSTQRHTPCVVPPILVVKSSKIVYIKLARSPVGGVREERSRSLKPGPLAAAATKPIYISADIYFVREATFEMR